MATLRARVPVAVQLAKFGLVGVSNTLLTLLVYTLLFHELGVWYVLASAVGYCVGAVNGYLLNGRWTFRGHEGGSTAAVRWIVVQAIGLGINEALVYGLVDGAHVGKLAAQALAIVAVVLVTFVANRRWTFPMRASEPMTAA